jgi:hypothetical protein
VTVRVGWGAGALEPPQPEREKERTPANSMAQGVLTLGEDDLTGIKDTKEPWN